MKWRLRERYRFFVISIWTVEVIALVKSDYEYGLTEEEISLYLNKSYDIEQMKILSECLHKDVPKDVIDIIKNTKYSVHQMQVSLEFYEKGVPVQTIKEVMDKGGKTYHHAPII